jgi:L-amino acid N-acyltransferase YncA
MNDNMEFRRARREEAEEILQLYQSLIGTEYCVWTENYPTEREVEFDLSRNALFCLYEKMLEPDERKQGADSGTSAGYERTLNRHNLHRR